uniref:Uncharacterized protein n=1 Tax=Setaria italica TaxID=4555 RepID=K3Z9N0_SETIT
MEDLVFNEGRERKSVTLKRPSIIVSSPDPVFPTAPPSPPPAPALAREIARPSLQIGAQSLTPSLQNRPPPVPRLPIRPSTSRPAAPVRCPAEEDPQRRLAAALRRLAAAVLLPQLHLRRQRHRSPLFSRRNSPADAAPLPAPTQWGSSYSESPPTAGLWPGSRESSGPSHSPHGNQSANPCGQVAGNRKDLVDHIWNKLGRNPNISTV